MICGATNPACVLLGGICNEVYGLLDPPFSHYTTDHGLSFLNEFMRSGVSQGNVDPLEKSVCLTCIERHDRINGTHFFEEASPLSRCRSSDGKVRWQFLGRGKDCIGKVLVPLAITEPRFCR